MPAGNPDGGQWTDDAVWTSARAEDAAPVIFVSHDRPPLRQGEAIEVFETAKYNRLYDRNAGLLAELRSRAGDGRHDLFRLYEHLNYQVRLNAAKWTYVLDKSRARAALASIRDSRWDPCAGDAGMTLAMIDEGIGRLD